MLNRETHTHSHKEPSVLSVVNFVESPVIYSLFIIPVSSQISYRAVMRLLRSRRGTLGIELSFLKLCERTETGQMSASAQP